MGILGGTAGYRLLRYLSPGGPTHLDGSNYLGRSKLEMLLGSGVWDAIRDRQVIDFGSGQGLEAIEMAEKGARSVLGLEVQERLRIEAAARAARSPAAARIAFAAHAEQQVHVIVSLDSFEHFADPGSILSLMYKLLCPGGVALISFGPPWYHPYGGHLFSVFPWAHLVFTEKCLIRWRSDFKTDGATRFCEVAGGLNQMTLARFRRLLADSSFIVERFDAVPIRKLRPIAWLSPEFTTSTVRTILRKPA